MKSVGMFVATLLLLSASAFAQAPKKAPPAATSRPLSAAAASHSTVLSWTNTITSKYNVYKAPCTGFVQGTGAGSVPGVGTCTTPGTFTKITATPIAATTFTDSAVSANIVAAYEVTSVCDIVGTCPSNFTVPSESIPSSIVAAQTPGDQPPPPSLTIPSLTKNINGNTETVTATWSDAPNVTDRFQFSDGTSFLQEGVTPSASGNFAERWIGSPRTTIYFHVNNVLGQGQSASI